MKKRRSAFAKDIRREIRFTLNRFMCIFLIVALGVAFFAGIRATQPDMERSADRFYDENNLMDVRIISTMGLTAEDAERIAAVEGIQDVMPAYSVDALHSVDETQNVLRVMSLPDTINAVSVSEGRLPQNKNECVIDSKLAYDMGYLNIGDEIELESGGTQDLSQMLENTVYTVTGIVTTPYYLSFERESSTIGTGTVSGFIMVNPENFTLDYYTDIYVTAQGAKELQSYDDEYEDFIDPLVTRLEELGKERCAAKLDEVKKEAQETLDEAVGRLAALLGEEAARKELEAQQQLIDELEAPEWYVLDRGYIQAYVEYGENGKRIGAIGTVFPVIFFLVAILVCLTTMTRMVEEERTQIGTLKALGYKSNKIASKYLIYALLASVGGSILGAIVGQLILPYCIMMAYAILYDNLPYKLISIDVVLGVTAGAIACACTILAAYLACRNALRQTAAELMRPAAPKPGKRVFLEHISFIWKRLSFTRKSSVRNLFRYKKRFFMTVLGIAGCMGLLLVGFGLHDSIFTIVDNHYGVIVRYNGTVTLQDNAEDEEKELFASELSQMDEIKGSIKVCQTSVNAGANEIEKSATVVVPETNENFDEYILLRDRVSHKEYSLKDYSGRAVVSEKLAKLLDVGVGDSIYLSDGDNRRAWVEIGAITENYIYHYVYMSADTYSEIFEKEPNYNNVYLLENDTSQDAEDNLGKKILAYDAAGGIRFNTGLAENVHDMLGSLNLVVYVLIISAGLLAFVVLYNLNNININERKRELATLKVLGFFNKEVAGYVYRENVMLTIIGALLGLVFGFFLHQYVIVTAEIDMTMFGREIKPLSYVYSIALTFVFSALVNAVMFFKLRAIDMVESLKSIE